MLERHGLHELNRIAVGIAHDRRCQPAIRVAIRFDDSSGGLHASYHLCQVRNLKAQLMAALVGLNACNLVRAEQQAQLAKNPMVYSRATDLCIKI